MYMTSPMSYPKLHKFHLKAALQTEIYYLTASITNTAIDFQRVQTNGQRRDYLTATASSCHLCECAGDWLSFIIANCCGIMASTNR